MDQKELKKYLEGWLTKRQLYLDKSRVELFKKAGTLENALLERLLTNLLEQIRTEDGRIVSGKSELSLSRAVDQVFEKFFSMDMPKLMSQMVGNLNQILQLNAGYYKGIYESDSKGKKFSAITKKVQNNLFKRLGVGEDLSISKDGYLDRMLKNDAGTRDRVKNIVYKSTINGMPLADFTKALKIEMTTIPDISEGWLKKYLRGFAYDVYTKFDRSINKEFAVRLDLKYFIYEGGLLETSRDFCIEKEGKVFTTEEAERDWPVDPLLLKTKAEKAAGVLLDYVPLEDMGRWRCNHLASYIGWQLAIQLRPDLVSTLTPEQKKLAGIADPEEKKPEPKADPDGLTEKERQIFDAAIKEGATKDQALQVAKLASAAQQVGPEIDKLANDIAKKYKGVVTPINYKKPNRILEKAINEYNGDVTLVKDAVRNTIIVDDDSSIPAIVEELKKSGYVIKVKQQVAETDPMGYSGYLLNLKLPNGVTGEVQINTKRMIYAKETPANARMLLGEDLYNKIAAETGIEGGLGHKFYEQYRVITPADIAKDPSLIDVKAQLEARSQRYYDNFRDRDITKLIDIKELDSYLPDINKDALLNLRYPTGLNVIDFGKKGAFYYAPTNTIHFNKNTDRYKYSPGGRLFSAHHEIGHAVHQQNKILYIKSKDGRAVSDPTLGENDFQYVISDEFKSLYKKLYDTAYNKGFKKLESQLEQRMGEYDQFEKYGYSDEYTMQDDVGTALDILGSLTEGKYGSGHSVAYYKNGYGKYAEIFAHGYGIQFRRSKAVSEFMPELEKLLDEFMKERFIFKK